MKEINNLRRYIDKVFDGVDWNKFFTHGSNGNTCYGFKEVFRLDYILGLLGCKAYRHKADYLEVLEREGLLDGFYRVTGIRWENPEQCKRLGFTRPSASQFHYVEGFVDQKTFEEFRNKVLITDSLIAEFAKRDFSLISVDGKHVRNSTHGNSSKKNIKSMNFVCENKLVHSVFAKSEEHWIKTKLCSVIDDLHSVLPGTLLFSADAIYNTPTVRDKINSMPNTEYVFSLKKNSALYNEAQELFQRRHHRCVFSTNTFKRKGQTVFDCITLCPREPREQNAFLRICRTTTFRNKSTTDYIYVVFSQQLPCTLETLSLVYSLKRKHWQVEEYHKKKDILLH